MLQITPQQSVKSSHISKAEDKWSPGTGFIVKINKRHRYIIIDNVAHSQYDIVSMNCMLGRRLRRTYQGDSFSLTAQNGKPVSFEVVEIHQDEKQLFAKNLAFLLDPQKFTTILKAYEIRHLYHITHVDNLTSILQKDLRCHNRINGYVDISNAEIQGHRQAKLIPFYRSLSLHNFVPLFFAPKSPMLSALRDKQHELVYLHIAPEVLKMAGTVFCDGNARSNITQFYKTLPDLDKLDWKLLHGYYWGADDIEEHAENKRKRSAEVLVLDHIQTKYITGISVRSYDILQKVKTICNDAQVPFFPAINPKLYFS